MKMYKKSELTYKDGYLVTKDNDVIGLAPMLVSQLNKLEQQIQKHRYIDKQPKATPAPTLDGFEFDSERDTIHFKSDTPKLEEKIKNALDLMEEIEQVNTDKCMNRMLDHELNCVVNFVMQDFVIDDDYSPMQFDCKTIGNPLELTEEKLIELVAELHCCFPVEEE